MKCLGSRWPNRLDTRNLPHDEHSVQHITFFLWMREQSQRVSVAQMTGSSETVAWLDPNLSLFSLQPHLPDTRFLGRGRSCWWPLWPFLPSWLVGLATVRNGRSMPRRDNPSQDWELQTVQNQCLTRDGLCRGGQCSLCTWILDSAFYVLTPSRSPQGAAEEKKNEPFSVFKRMKNMPHWVDILQTLLGSRRPPSDPLGEELLAYGLLLMSQRVWLERWVTLKPILQLLLLMAFMVTEPHSLHLELF